MDVYIPVEIVLPNPHPPTTTTLNTITSTEVLWFGVSDQTRDGRLGTGNWNQPMDLF
jgi:hypothetical protein